MKKKRKSTKRYSQFTVTCVAMPSMFVAKKPKWPKWASAKKRDAATLIIEMHDSKWDSCEGTLRLILQALGLMKKPK